MAGKEGAIAPLLAHDPCHLHSTSTLHQKMLLALTNLTTEIKKLYQFARDDLQEKYIHLNILRYTGNDGHDKKLIPQVTAWIMVMYI